MINRINKAPVLKLVALAPKQSENDPGSSQGNGMFYDGPPQKEQQSSTPEENQQPPVVASMPQEESAAEPHLKAVQEQSTQKPKLKSLNSVYEFFFSRKKERPAAGLTTQYSDDHASAKGMLLNKKAE